MAQVQRQQPNERDDQIRMQGECRGKATDDRKFVTYGKTEEEAYKRMIEYLLSSPINVCRGKCPNDRLPCKPVLGFDKDDYTIRAFLSKTGKTKWRCKFEGTVTWDCECVDDAD